MFPASSLPFLALASTSPPTTSPLKTSPGPSGLQMKSSSLRDCLEASPMVSPSFFSSLGLSTAPPHLSSLHPSPQKAPPSPLKCWLSGLGHWPSSSSPHTRPWPPVKTLTATYYSDDPKPAFSVSSLQFGDMHNHSSLESVPCKLPSKPLHLPS